ncbi:protein BNIP5 [Ctenodactylus gundi]
MANPRGLRRAQSLDRSQAARKDSESSSCQCLSLPTMPGRKALCWAASDGFRTCHSTTPSTKAPKAAAVVHTPELTRELLPCEQRSPPDIKKDKTQRLPQQGWLKTVLNFLLRVGAEEPREKASKRPRGKEESTEPSETLGQTALRKIGQKTSLKKPGHKKYGAEEPKGTQDQEAGSHEAGLPKMATTSHSEEAHLGPACREDAVIQMIVQFLKKIGDQWEEEQFQAPQPTAALLIPALPCRRSQVKKSSSFKRTFSLKKPSPEEPRRVDAADMPSPEARPPRRPSFLPLCIGGHRPSISSPDGSRRADVHEAPYAERRGPSPSELAIQTECQAPEEELPLDRASESNEFLQKILALLQDTEEQTGEQPQVQEAEVTVENQAPIYRKKSLERKSSNLKRAFSLKKHNSKEPRKAGAGGTVGAGNPEARPPKRPSFLPLCVGGHRPSVSSSNGELVIRKLVALLQKVDGDLGKQIRRHPSFQRFLYEFSDSDLRKLVATLHSQEARSADRNRYPTKRLLLLTFGMANKYVDNHSRTICSLMGSGGHYSQPRDAQFPSSEAQQVREGGKDGSSLAQATAG